MDFPSSSHRTRWIFTKEQLHDIKLHLNEQAGRSGRASSADNDNETPTADAGNESKRLKDSPPVTLEEERKLLRFYESKVSHLCLEMRLPKKVQATALVYFKRYFLKHSCITADPLKILLTCIYLSAKIEESYISAEEFCRVVKKDPSTVLRTEVGLLQVLHFDLVVHSPYRALTGLLQDLDEARKSAEQGSAGSSGLEAEVISASDDVIAQCRAKATGAVDALMLTDAPLLYPPGQLALAALRSGLKARGLRLGISYFERAVGKAMVGADQQAVQAAVASLAAAIDDIDKMGMEGAAAGKVEQQEVADIDKKIKLFKAKTQSAAGDRDDMDKSDRREAKVKARREAAASEQPAAR